MKINSFLIISIFIFLAGCQTSSINQTAPSISGSQQKTIRRPAETVTIGNNEETTADREGTEIILHDLRISADVSIPQGSSLKTNNETNLNDCTLQVRGPKQLILGQPEDQDKLYRLDLRVPGYLDNNGYTSMAGIINLGLSLPLDKENPYQAGSMMDYAGFLKGENYFYKDGKLTFFEVTNQDQKYFKSGGKKKPIFITKHTIEVDPLLKNVKSITTEIRFGDVYRSVSSFEKMPLKAKTTCANNNSIAATSP